MAKSRSEIFRLSDEYSDKLLHDDYIGATWSNINTYDSMWNDYSYVDTDPFVKTAKKYYKAISEAEPIDRYDEIAKKVILSGIEDYLSDIGDPWHYINWGSVFSDPDSIYSVFKQMPKETKGDILNIVKRLEKIPSAITEWVSAMHDVEELGYVNSKWRVGFVIDVISNIVSKELFLNIATEIDPNNKRLAKAAKDAHTSYIMLLWWMRAYSDRAPEAYHVGEERYVRLVKDQTGLSINPREVYEWGLQELDRINAEMWKVGKQINPKAKKLTDFADTLNNDPRYKIKGREEFKEFLESIIDTAIKGLHGSVFDINKASRNCIVELDDITIDESPYYLAPSDDLEKPGRTLYPTLGKNEFSTWENYSTWFHESIPGHHMQFVVASLNKDTLTKYQRTDAWNSGYGEGWALYSEKLMDELGYFEDPGYKMGYLLCQAMRAARLVVDIGLHLQYNSPEGRPWTRNQAIKLMKERALLNHDYAVSEINRYISWAGQAITYKLGERVWLEARENAKARLGDKFNLKKFHMYALKLGPMNLNLLEEELAKWNGK